LQKLCKNPVAQYAFFIKMLYGMAITSAKALVKRAIKRINMIKAIIQDILSGKLGPPVFGKFK